MERSLIKNIEEWYDDSNKKLLIVTGAAGVGKTWLIEQFCERQSIEYIRPDRIKSACKELCTAEDKKLIFADNVDGKEQLEAIRNILLETAGDNLLGNYRIIMAGRMVCEHVYRDAFNDIFTDEEVMCVRLYPVSFAEFVKALQATYRMDAYNMLKIYMIVGGMPECICSFIKDGDLTRVREKQRTMIDNLHFGIGHSDVRVLKKCHEVIKSLPNQPWEATGFTLRKISANARERDYACAISLLEDYGVVSRIQRFGGSSGRESKNYKLYLMDVGLYGALSGMNERTIYCEEDLFDKTMVINFTIQELMAYGISEKWHMCYWNGHRIKAKLPIVLAGENTLVPMELMARESAISRSMNSFLLKYQVNQVIKVLNPLRRKTKDIELQKITDDFFAELYQLENVKTCLTIWE